MNPKVLDQVRRGAIVVICLVLIWLAFAPKTYGQVSGNKTSEWIVSDSKILNGAVSIWNSYQNNQIAHIKSSGKDTLVIDYPSLVDNRHLFSYIKIGDKLFQEVRPVIDWKSRLEGWSNQYFDSALGSKIYFYNQKNSSNHERK